MRQAITILVLATIAALGLYVARGPAAPALTDKPVRWEYAELQSRGDREPRQFGGVGMLAPGGVGQPGAAAGFQGGVAAPAGPATPPTIRFITAEEEIESPGWKELADKLKAPAPKKDGSVTLHRLRVLNRLSADGWEIYEHTGTTTYTFRRRVQ